ncbi:hypothetical protein KEM09_07020 [Carboxylicivirga mesophila]|uniref:Uncharacterized protein n=1 Tax=Carboxylicivirga mesophila TaxID=1166478 RepID=A0ABS5K835_9BACT|nr:hypothetical protein [Carboxylicivirga mesophila]MBS2211145.1 hypothetical protein [Carboxylicivirga mesophila]
MDTVYKTQQYTIGGIRFTVNLLCPLFDFDPMGGSSNFSSVQPTSLNEWTINIRLTEKINHREINHIFTGADKFDTEIPYKWSVIRNSEDEGIFVEFENHQYIKEALANISIQRKEIGIDICAQHLQAFSFDPFFHPLGILLLQYIIHQYGGFVIHASTVEYKDKGYLFSAVSGTGKSTMAELWRQQGATIINDDRLIILPDKEGFVTYNTPMPYYQDNYKSVRLHKTFLISQSPHNYIKKLPAIKGTMGLLSNCMQFQYDEQQVQSRLDALLTIAESCGVYECGFKPDNEIVNLILQKLG